MESDSRKALRIRLLGPFEAAKDGKAIPASAWSRPKTLQLLKLLLSEPGRTFTQDQLVDLLFPDLAPDNAVNNLQGRVSELRRALEPELPRGNASSYILRLPQGYGVQVEDIWLDTIEFERRLALAASCEQKQDWPNAIAHYEHALALYQGDLLEEDPYEEWTLAPRERLREQFSAALEALGECHARLGQYAHAIATCKRCLERSPCRESAYYALMVYYDLSGQRAEALKAYQACAKALADALDAAPSPKLSKLHDVLQRGAGLDVEGRYPLPLSPGLLRKVSLFAELEAPELQSIVDASQEQRFAAGSAIVREGDLGETFYLILDGQVEIRLGLSPVKLGRGQFFGEMSLIDEWSRSADVVATIPTRCMALHKQALTNLIEGSPRLALKFLREMARRLRSTDQSLSKRETL